MTYGLRCPPAAALVALFVFSTPTNAELVSRDWLAPGDGLLTYNPATGREWLDVTQTFLQPFGDTIDGAVEAAKPEILAGGRFEGFTLAGREEVLELVAASGFVNTFPENLNTGNEMRALLNLLDVRGEEIRGDNGGPILDGEAGGIYGVIDEVVSMPSEGSSANVTAFLRVGSASPFAPSGGGAVNFRNSTGEPRVPFQSFVNSSALMLYRTAVPEPGGLTAIAFAWLALLSGPRRSAPSESLGSSL